MKNSFVPFSESRSEALTPAFVVFWTGFTTDRSDIDFFNRLPILGNRASGTISQKLSFWYINSRRLAAPLPAPFYHLSKEF